MVVIRVPATTANLGPGFDCLGLALNLYARFSFDKRDTGLVITGCEMEFAHEDNLVYQAFLAAIETKGLKPQGVSIHIDSDIPVSRGLGSSAACVVGGILGANALYHLNLSQEEVFALAAKLEGHPDNVAPALFGGLTVSLTQDGAPHALPSPLHPELRFLALIPDFTLSTKMAREALKQVVSFKDAVYNLSRSAYLLKALENGNENDIRLGCKDRLHQDARFELIEDGARLKKHMEEQGAYAVFLSGAGPTLMCLYKDPAFEKKAELITRTAFPRFRAVPLHPCETGAAEERNFPT